MFPSLAFLINIFSLKRREVVCVSAFKGQSSVLISELWVGTEELHEQLWKQTLGCMKIHGWQENVCSYELEQPNVWLQRDRMGGMLFQNMNEWMNEWMVFYGLHVQERYDLRYMILLHVYQSLTLKNIYFAFFKGFLWLLSQFYSSEKHYATCLGELQ